MVMFQQQEHIEYIRVTSNQVRGQCTRVPQTLPVQHTAGFEKEFEYFRFNQEYLPSTPGIEHRISRKVLSKTKIGKFDITIFIQKNIFRF